MDTLRPGTPVRLLQRIQKPLVDIPAGAFGIVVFASRGVARVQFIDYIMQDNVPLEWLRIVQEGLQYVPR
jgi:hypothetical protein